LHQQSGLLTQLSQDCHLHGKYRGRPGRIQLQASRQQLRSLDARVGADAAVVHRPHQVSVADFGRIGIHGIPL